MNLLDPLFRWEPVAKLFRDEASLQVMLDFEAALARAEAAAGVIPSAAAAAIAAKCHAELFDIDKVAQAAALSGNLAIPLIAQLKELVAAAAKSEKDSHSAGFVHFGATSQDTIDTACVLQLREALKLIEGELGRLTSALVKLADEHRTTILIGRTWLQHAVPTTLGVKFAGWLDALDRHRQRLRETQTRCIVLQFGGAVGTLATLGPQGAQVARHLSEELQLPQPAIPWHSHRDRMAEIATTMGLLCGTLGKIARDISLHGQTEIGELREPSEVGRGGSSTMPHKRNPVASAVILSAAMRVPGLVSTMLSTMVQEDERGLGGWHAEWETLPEIVSLTAAAAHRLSSVVPNLEIDVARMRANLELDNGLIFAEAISAALGKKTGHAQARKLIDSACQHAYKEKKHLRNVIENDKEIGKHLSHTELAQLFDAGNQLGSSNLFIDQVIARHGLHK
jgi:3-carboxy-cis,cis-muconate cycloisomerase